MASGTDKHAKQMFTKSMVNSVLEESTENEITVYLSVQYQQESGKFNLSIRTIVFLRLSCLWKNFRLKINYCYEFNSYKTCIYLN